MVLTYEVKDMKYYIGKFSSSLESFFLPILLFFAPILGVLITVGTFILLDTVSGIWKARATKTPITSRGLSGVVSKMLLYQLCILSAYLLDFYILGDILQSVFGIEGLIIKSIALLLIFIEAQSINENYKIVKGVDMWHEFKKMLRRAKEVTTEVTGIHKSISDIKIGEDKIQRKKPSQDLGDIFED
tara:strand:- start:34409 stop:34969 length:561 start_codon:yes stop_codon:yes gene_type:complete